MSSTKSLVIALIALVSLASAGSLTRGQAETLIVGGSSAVKGQFPYQVSIRDIYTHQHFCGGVIINEHFILTAAHCFFQRTLNSMSFYGVVNKTDATDEGTRIEFRGALPHPDFGVMGPQPDIALIVTKDRLIFSKFVAPVNLPTQEYVEPGTKAVLSGWGIYKMMNTTKDAPYNPKQFPTTLQFKELTTLSLDECIADFDPLKKKDEREWQQVVGDLSDDIICTKNHIGSGSCIGDSGGPLVSGNTLIGLVSWCVGCVDGYPTVFTRVYPQLEWVKEEMDDIQTY